MITGERTLERFENTCQRPSSLQPVPSPPDLGGKRNLAKRICAIIDADGHSTYAEPFVGMGGIFLRRTARPKAEFINDTGRDVYTLFRILQEHYIAFLDLLRFQLTTQANFNRLVDTDPETLTDLQRAARFLYLQRTAFGGKPSGRNFGIATDRPARFNLTTLEPDLEALHARLSAVTITCMDYAAFIARMDRKGTFFLPRSALLGLRKRLRQRPFHPRRLRPAGRTPSGSISTFGSHFCMPPTKYRNL
jgi:DNA adenine methylase